MTAFQSPLNKDFSDLRTIYVQKCSMSDEDNDFHSDMLYFRALLNDIVELAMERGFANPIPKTLSAGLAKTGFWWPTDKARKLLDGWHD
jgi:hypothetical protein